MKIGLIGCGKVGISFTTLLRKFTIVGIYDRNIKKIHRAKRILKKKMLTPDEMTKKADLILIATHDDQIEVVAKKLRRILKTF